MRVFFQSMVASRRIVHRHAFFPLPWVNLPIIGKPHLKEPSLNLRPALLLLSVLGAPALHAQQAPLPDISDARFRSHIQTLASDAMEGRAPGSDGEKLSIAYLEKQFRALGLKPGNPDGSYLQAVPLRHRVPATRFSFRIGGKEQTLKPLDDYVLASTGPSPKAAIKDSELVFAGYGAVAPEYGWDDFKDADVRGKTVVLLINDPPLADQSLFRGKAMTYYGRWTYKYEIARKKGAAAVLIVHEDGPAGYPYDVVRSSFGGEQFSLKREGDDPDAPEVPGWIRLDAAKAMFAAAGLDFAALKQQALSKDFRPVSLKGTASFEVDNRERMLDSHNVAGLIEGSDPQLKKEYVIYSAHWDHLGKDGSKIYRGALDNASGVAALLEIARAFRAQPAPKRSVLFIATTAEERGLLGAKYYAAHPLYPLRDTVADINIDGINAWGRTAAIEHVTSGHSSLDAVLEKYARLQGRSVAPDSRPELGSFYRADQLEFARVGVPVLYTKARSGYLDKPEGYADKVVNHYYTQDYHKASDDYRADWDFSGGLQDVQLLFQVGYDLASGAPRPVWNASSEFRR
jgi:Zn-dependent M28 family amino/carboxypeptidase